MQLNHGLRKLHVILRAARSQYLDLDCNSHEREESGLLSLKEKHPWTEQTAVQCCPRGHIIHPIIATCKALLLLVQAGKPHEELYPHLVV